MGTLNALAGQLGKCVVWLMNKNLQQNFPRVRSGLHTGTAMAHSVLIVSIEVVAVRATLQAGRANEDDLKALGAAY